MKNKLRMKQGFSSNYNNYIFKGARPISYHFYNTNQKLRCPLIYKSDFHCHIIMFACSSRCNSVIY